MNAKERVLAAIHHRTPDRTPCGFVSTPEIDERLLRHFQTDSMEQVRCMLGVDWRVIDAPYSGPELKKWPNARFGNFWGQVRKPVKNEAGIPRCKKERPTESIPPASYRAIRL